MRLLCRMNQVAEDLLIGMAWFLWIVVLILGVAKIDLHIRLTYVLTMMAATGTICGLIRRRDERTIAALGRELADATRPGHHDHHSRHLHRVPGAQ